MNEAISVKNLIKRYGKENGNGHLALDGLNLSVPQGSIFGLLGPNGAGKSTLINILAGTVVKSSGEVKVAGVDIDEAPKEARSLIGIVPQEVVFDSFFPIEQALEFTAGYFGVKPHLRKTEELLKALSLWDKKNTMPRGLSGGMKRRFLIAKAMVHSPPVLILDEPTAGVDIELRTQLWDYVKKLNEQGVTIIITTHYLAEAQELCDEIAFINKGKIIKQDSKQNLLQELGARHIDVEFEADINLAELKISSSVNVETISDNQLRFSLKSKTESTTKLLKEIHNTGKEIKDIRISQPDLEDIFYKIMQ